MIREILHDIFGSESSMSDRFIAGLLAVTLALAVAMCGIIAYIAVDRIGIKGHQSAVVVVSYKSVVPPHTSIIWTGKVAVPQYHPESYHISFSLYGQRQSVSVRGDVFDAIEVGQKVNVTYGFGRISGSMQIVSLPDF